MTDLESLRAEVARLFGLTGDLMDLIEILRGQANQSEKLRGQLEALRGSDELVTIKALTADIERLTAERDALRVDAERYRWLRADRKTTLIVSFFGNGCINRTIEEVDAVIDAARAAKGTK